MNATNFLVAKKCQKCDRPMHIHRTGEEIIFAGCEPCIIDIKIERVKDDELVIKGKRSTKAVRCQSCKVKHLLHSFKEVKDGVSSTRKGTQR